MKEKIIFSMLSFCLILIGIIIGIKFTIVNQKPIVIDNKNNEIKEVVIDLLGQEWIYEL